MHCSFESCHVAHAECYFINGTFKRKCSSIFDASLFMQRFMDLSLFFFFPLFQCSELPGRMERLGEKWTAGQIQGWQNWKYIIHLRECITRRLVKGFQDVHSLVCCFPQLWIPKTETRGLDKHQQLQSATKENMSKLLQYYLKSLVIYLPHRTIHKHCYDF